MPENTQVKISAHAKHVVIVLQHFLCFKFDYEPVKLYNKIARKVSSLPGVDVREPVLFSGMEKQEFVQKAGHIPGAVNLPASEAYTKLGTFKKKEDLERLAAAAVGRDKSREIFTYCDAGKCCPTWAFILTRVLGYKNVRLYDGSFEEWTKDSSLPVSR